MNDIAYKKYINIYISDIKIIFLVTVVLISTNLMALFLRGVQQFLKFSN